MEPWRGILRKQRAAECSTMESVQAVLDGGVCVCVRACKYGV